jgi:AraC-like DNA-binding protein
VEDMYDIYATDFAFEQCEKDKREINMLMPYSVFHFVLSGEGYINGQRISKNTVFISSIENHMHYYPSRTDPWSYIYVRIVGEDVKKAFKDFDFNNGITVLNFSDNESLYNLLSLFEKMAINENEEAKKLIANAVLLLFSERKKDLCIKNKSNERLEQIKKYIDENYYKKITMEEVALKFYLNKNYMRTLFVKNMGVSPKQYLCNIRFNRAQYLLLSSDESVKLIANSVGYDDPLLFSKIFKERYGCSPTQYRKKH